MQVLKWTLPQTLKGRVVTDVFTTNGLQYPTVTSTEVERSFTQQIGRGILCCNLNVVAQQIVRTGPDAIKIWTSKKESSL